MATHIRTVLILALVAVSGAARASGDDEARARQEVDQALTKALVAIPAPRLSLTVEPRGPEGMRLDTITARLDGKVVHMGGAQAAPGITTVTLWAGKVAPGPHQVQLQVTWSRTASYGRQMSVTLAGGLHLDAEKGLAVDVHTRLVASAKTSDVKHRYRLQMAARPRMLAQVDSGKMPPAPKPVKRLVFNADGGIAGAPGKTAVAAAAVDAGVPPPPAPPVVKARSHPRLALARRHPRHRRHRVRAHRRPRLHASPAAFAPSRTAAKAAPPAPAKPAAVAAASSPPPAAPTPARPAAAPPPPKPAPPATHAAPATGTGSHGRILAFGLAGAGILAILIAGLLFLRR